RLGDADDLRAIHRDLRREFLIIRRADLRFAGDRKAEARARHAREPRARAVRDLAVFVRVAVLAEIIHVARRLRDREIIAADFLELTGSGLLLLDDTRLDAIDLLRLVGHGDGEHRFLSLFLPLENRDVSRFEDEPIALSFR